MKQDHATARPRTALPIRWEPIQTGVMVILFTGLIWWTADQAVTESRQISVRLQLLAEPGMTARILRPASPDFTLTLSGSKRLMDQIQNDLRNADHVLDFRIEKQDWLRSRSTPMLAREVFSRTTLLAGSGVRVDYVEPDEMLFSVARLVSRTMAVEPDFGALAVERVSVDPQVVSVMLPEYDVESAAAFLRPSVEAHLRNWIRSHPGEHEFEIQVTLPREGITRVEPASVMVRGAITGNLDTRVFGPVQILPAIPPRIQERFLVQPASDRAFRTDLTIRGPRERLAALITDEVQAYVSIMTQDEGAANQIILRRADIFLPAGLELVGDPPEVAFRLVPRDGGSPPPP
ncbi:MAG: hypothetical protein V3T70_09245 [Phycisphaerae bacterium]